MCETTRTHRARVRAREVWERCYADARAWPEWNPELASTRLEGPFEVGTVARVRFRTGLRLKFRLVEVERERVFTDEARAARALPDAQRRIEELASSSRGS